MNIYIDVEISSRELDSGLLLAILAASKGHKVLISRLSEIILGFKSGILAPGIFHTTNLAPTSQKILRHQKIIDNGSVITSIDEEGGLIDYGYDKFAKVRYSEKTLKQSAAVFGWGLEDTETLKKIYHTHYNKIHVTGSARADLWRQKFYRYWGIPRQIPKKPYLLVSSNMFSITKITPFHKYFKYLKQAGYFQRDPDLFFKQFKQVAEDSRKTGAFVEAIIHLANNSNGFDIVLRPHPTENIEAWKIFLEDIPNVHVIQNDSITPWVNNAFAVMHNSCTTAIEATVSGKPVVTYIPFHQEHSSREVANKLGHKTSTLKELSETVNNLFNGTKINGQEDQKKIPDIISKKIYFDKDELSAEKIVKIWESLDNKKLSETINWIKFYWLLKISDLKIATGKFKRKLFPSKFGPYKEIYKFPILKKNDIDDRLNKMCQVLEINEKIKCDLISNRTVLIRKF